MERTGGTFVGVNCAALPEALAEGGLFGYRRGAFTGADKASPGFFRSADGGTLFLDEVTDLPLPLQAKLLRVLEEREVQALGEPRPIPIDVRVLVAGQVSLLEASRQGQFRPDLLARHDWPFKVRELLLLAAAPSLLRSGQAGWAGSASDSFEGGPVDWRGLRERRDAQPSEQVAILVVQALHAPQNVGQRTYGLVDERALVQHHAFGGNAGGRVGHLSP
jgi:two-component system response regulator FlrC